MLGKTVIIQDENSHWTTRCVVVIRRAQQGMETSSYLLKKTKTSKATCRNKRFIRRFDKKTPSNKKVTLDNKVTVNKMSPHYTEYGSNIHDIFTNPNSTLTPQLSQAYPIKSAMRTT